MRTRHQNNISNVNYVYRIPPDDALAPPANASSTQHLTLHGMVQPQQYQSHNLHHMDGGHLMYGNLDVHHITVQSVSPSKNK